MKKVVAWLIGATAILAVSGFFFEDTIKQTIYDYVTRDMFVDGDHDQFDPGLPTGAQFPAISAQFEGAEITSITRFGGQRGTVFIASRSFDWCPYCMRQIMELEIYKAAFEAAGISLVAMTYDDPALQQAFIDKHDITIPVLSDLNARSFTALSILNPDYQPQDEHYGLPSPGMFVIDKQGTIVGKLFVEAYSTRVDAKAALAFAKQALDSPE